MNSTTGQASLYEINLPASLDLRAAAPLATALLSARGGGMRLDGSQVKTVGAQCLQVIVSARQTWERDGLPLTIANPTEELLAAFADTGLDIDSIVESESAR
jgi:chemotaxis protein CheX